MIRFTAIALMLLIFCAVTPAQEVGDTVPADDLAAGMRLVLGADLEAEYEWTLIGEDERAAEKAEEHERLNPPQRIWHVPLAQGRSVFKFEFTRPYVTDRTTFHLYVDADEDEDTGRQDSNVGTDYMFTVSSGGRASLRVFDEDGESTSASPRIVLEDDVIYLSADMDLKQEDGNSVFEYWVTSWVRDDAGDSLANSRVSRRRAVSQGEPDIEVDEFKRVAIIDTEDLEIDRVNAQVLHPEFDGDALCARITWRSNWITPGTVEYGLTQELGSSAEMPFSNRNHRVILDNLQPDTTYHYRVWGLTPQGTRLYSDTKTFSTEPPDHPAPAVERGTTPLRVTNRAGIALEDWPVRAGVPFTRGDIFSTENIRLLGPDGAPYPSAWSVLSRWPDKSIRWAAVEFRADAPAALTEYAVEYGSSVIPSADESALRVEAGDDVISVDTGRLRFDVQREPFAAFTNVQVRGEDGTWRESSAGEMTLLAEDTDGLRYEGARGVREFELEHLNSEVAIIRAEGDHIAEDGSELLHWEVRIYAYADSPMARVFHTFGMNDLTEQMSEFRRIALAWQSPADAGAPFALGGDEPIALQVPADGQARLFQHIDDEYSLELPAGEQSGNRAAGWVSVGEGESGMTIAMRDFWEHYPKSIQVAPGVVEMDIAPVLAPDQYDAFPELEHVLFAPFRGGVYRFMQGLQKRHEMMVQFGARDDDAIEAFRSPAVVAVPPERHRDTEGLGRIAISADLPPEFADYTDAVRDGLEGYIEEREEERLYGFMHFGDWFGERRYNWGNVEYDTPHGFLMEFASSGDPEFFVQGEHAARHYMDIDVVHHAEDPRHIGLIWVHAMLHTGGYYERRPEEFDPAYGVGSARNWGHMWGEGLADYYWLSGDPRSRETLLKIADMAASEYLEERGHVQPGTGWIIARHPGWMSKIMIAGYAISGDEYYLNAAKTHLDYWAEFQTENGGWDRRLGGGHCACDPPHIGEAGFMVAVLMSGMKRYHELTGDEKIGESIVKGSRWLIEDLWMPEGQGFRYTSCPTKLSAGGAMHMIEPVTYAHRLEPDAIFRDTALQRASRQLMRVSASGKGISAHINTIPQTLGDLVEMTHTDYYALSGPGPHTVLLKETEDRDFEVTVEAWGEGAVTGRVTLAGPDGQMLAERSISGTGRVIESIEVPADEQVGVHNLVLEPERADISWEVRNSLYRNVVEMSENTEVGGGIAYPRYRFYVWPDTDSFTLRMRSSEVGDRTVTLLDPNGHVHSTHEWRENGDGEWQTIVVEPPEFEPIAVGFSYRGPLNDSDRQWSIVGDGAPVSIIGEGIGSGLAASYVSHFVPERPRAFIGGQTALNPGETPTVRLDGTTSQALDGRITDYDWDLGDGTRLSGPTIEHTYAQDGQYEVTLNVTDDRGRADTQTLLVSVPPPELVDAEMTLVKAAEFIEQEGGEVMVVSDRIGADGNIITGWEGNPGHTLTWEVMLEEAGQYALGLKFASSRQGTTRDFFINGEQPHPEMAEVPFPFTGGWSRSEDNWEYAILRDEDGAPLRFGLEAGRQTITGADRSGGLAVDLLMLIRLDDDIDL